MGGRGASSGISANGKPYGSEYTTVLQSGNIKFVTTNNGSNTAPLETMTKGRIYVTVDKSKNEPKYITYYNKEFKRFKQIDLDHFHKINGKPRKPHTQYGYLHDGKADILSKGEQKLLDTVHRIWKNRRSKS